MKNTHLQTSLLTLALALGSGALLAQPAAGATLVAQAESPNIAAAIETYRQAQADLQAAEQSGGDVATATANLETATAELAGMCTLLGQPDIEACIAAVEAGATPATSAEPAAEPAPAEAPQETAPVEDAQPQPAEAPEQDAAADTSETVAEPMAEPEPAAEPEPMAESEPVAEPEPVVDLPPEALVAAVAEYETVNSALADAASDTDTAALQSRLASAQAGIAESCAAIGEPDVTACLDRFGIALSPMAEIGQTETAAEPVAEPTQPAEEPAPQPEEPAAAPESNATTAEPVAEPEPEPVNPGGTPLPRELGSAIAAYEQANRQLAAAVVSTPEAEAANQAVDTAIESIAALCEQSGEADIEVCLSTYGVALTARAEPMSAEAAATEPEQAAPAEETPLLDSDKDTAAADADAGATTSEKTAEAAENSEPAAPPPQSDAEAQAEVAPESITSIESEQATSAEVASDPDAPSAIAAEAPAGARVVEQSGPRIVFQFNNQLVVSNQADNRLGYGASERYVQPLPRDRVRETIVRADGTRLITVYDRYGNVLRRSHFDAYGNETILAYVPESYDSDVSDWMDPGQNLPPLRLGIAPEDYVLDASRAELDELAGFLSAPPVEKVRRIYSIDEVKRSARLRDMTRRLEIGNLTFAFGAASIPPDQIGALSIVANAMLELIDRNPGETFLIEGHTDAVGSDLNNLVLSDARAYSVAIALTEVFGIPPENIATQGYGERYLKVNTQAPEEANRRVTIRRITALIAPASVAAN